MNSYIQSLPTPVSASLFTGGVALAYYGTRKWSKAHGVKETMIAGGYTAFGVSLAAVGVLGAISELRQYMFPSRSPSPLIPETVREYPTVSRSQGVQACHTVFQAGIQPGGIASAEVSELDSSMPPLQEGKHYTDAEGGVDSQRYLYCWARLTELGKAFIGSDSLRIHTSQIPGSAYAKINLR